MKTELSKKKKKPFNYAIIYQREGEREREKEEALNKGINSNMEVNGN